MWRNGNEHDGRSGVGIMNWLAPPNPIHEKKRRLLQSMILREIEAMTVDQLATAIVIAKKVRSGDPRIIAILED